MKDNQLPLFLKRAFRKGTRPQVLAPVTPTGESSLMQTLPAFLAYVAEKYAPKTAKMYFGDVKALSLFLRQKKVGEITSADLQQWTGALIAANGKRLQRKTLNRKVSAVITYFLWLQSVGAITEDPTIALNNTRIQSPLPDYLYESEVKILLEKAGKDLRTYLLVLLFLETGMKSSEVFLLKKAHVDLSDLYNPELWIKHTGKDTKKDRKVALPTRFTAVYKRYVKKYEIEDTLFPFTDRFLQLLFADLKSKTKIDKELTPKTLRHTHVVRAYKGGESFDTIFERIGLAPDSRQEAEEIYWRLARRGI